MKIPVVALILASLVFQSIGLVGQSIAEWSNGECQVRVVETFPGKTNEELYSAFKKWAKSYFWDGKRVIKVHTHEVSQKQFHEEPSKLFEVMDHNEKLWIETAFDTVAHFYSKSSKRPDKMEYSFFIEFEGDKVVFKLYNFFEPDLKTKACEVLFSKKGEAKDGKEAMRIRAEMEAYGSNLMRLFKANIR